MRISAYPRAFSLYPNWLKPVLVSLGAMFVVTALFLMILIWKSAPSAAAQAEMSTAGLVAPTTITPIPPAPTGRAAVPEPREVPAAAATVSVHKSAKHKKLAHHKKRHTKVARARVSSKRSGGKDPLLDLLR